MAERGGFEPQVNNNQVVNDQCIYDIEGSQVAQIDSQRIVTSDPDLSRLVARWAKLPINIRQAISLMVGGEIED